MQRKGESNMGIWDDIKKGLKGSDEYRAGKAKKKASKKAKTIAKASKKRDKAKKSGKVGKQKRAQNKINKASGSDKKHTKKTIKDANAKDKSWSKATKAAKKSGGPGISTLVKARGMHKKGSNEYNQIQNKINEHYGSTKVHKVTKKKVAGKVKDKRPIVVTAKTDARPSMDDKELLRKDPKPVEKKVEVKTPKGDTLTQEEKDAGWTRGTKKPKVDAKSEYQKGVDEAKKITEDARKALAATQKKEMGGMVDRPQYGSGGKVEGGGLFNFPTSHSRKK
tara:strand:+ start:438 stop:1274 length:837 start_codon:yes stop_codon:yes gene_type:complete